MRVKICGLTDQETFDASISAGADYVGLVFFEKSPRNVSISLARQLALSAPVGVCKTGLFVSPSDSELEKILQEVPLDMIQLHGDESAQRVAEIKASFGLPVMKAIGIGMISDLSKINEFSKVADQLLIDAKASEDSNLPGGNGVAFDWNLLSGRRWAVPWMLAGGLRPTNIGAAIQKTGASQVDVSSGVEVAPGVKEVKLISEFIGAAKGEA